MNRTRPFSPICHESRDLGYTRRMRQERSQDILSLALGLLFVIGCALCVWILGAKFGVHSWADFVEFARVVWRLL